MLMVDDSTSRDEISSRYETRNTTDGTGMPINEVLLDGDGGFERMILRRSDDDADTYFLGVVDTDGEEETYVLQQTNEQYIGLNARDGRENVPETLKKGLFDLGFTVVR